MTRKQRIYSYSGFMHIIERGIGQQLLFEDSQDYSYYISLMEKYSKETAVKINAYCLMDNHVHILIYDSTGAISKMMQKIGVSYANYFNTKYDRVGHLFQDRFKSEIITSERYLVCVFRYILNNPKAAGICPASEYPWSSYHLYEDETSFVDTSCFTGVIGNRKSLLEYLNCRDETDFEYMEFNDKHDDSWAKKQIGLVLGITSGTDLQSYERKERNEAIRKLKSNGLSVRQIARLTGIGRGVVLKV